MNVVLEPGEEVYVRFAETDGKFRIAFNDDPASIVVEALDHLPDDRQRHGLLYNACLEPSATSKVEVVQPEKQCSLDDSCELGCGCGMPQKE